MLRHRILIVADDAVAREVIRLALAGLGAELHCAADRDAMQRCCRRLAFDVVLVLRASPFLCGGQPVRALRPAGLRRPALYVLSWQQAEQTVLSLLEEGVDQYLTFPVSLPRLRRKVAEALDETR